MRQRLKTYLEEQFMFEFGEEITEDTDLFKAGILDSFGYVSLMAHLEQEYGVRIGEGGFLDNVAVSFSGIAGLVEEARVQAAEGR